MSTEHSPRSATQSRVTPGGARRAASILGSILVGTIVFLAAWLFMTTAFMAALLGTGVGVVLVASSFVSDVLEAILEAIGSIFTGILAIVGAIFGAIFSIFN